MENHRTEKMQLRSNASSFKCSVFSCKNHLKDTQFRRPSLTYYPFPKDKNLTAIWKKFCNNSDNSFENSVVCSDHFSPNDFIISSRKVGSRNKRRILKSSAVPSIYKPENVWEDATEQIKNPSTNYTKKTKEMEGNLKVKKNMSETNAAQETNLSGESFKPGTRRNPRISYYRKKRIFKENPINGTTLVKENFISLLKDYPILLNPSVALKIRSRKTRALKSMALTYKKKFGKQISRFQLRKKVDDMKKYIRDKLNKIRSNNIVSPQLKKWEQDIIKLLQPNRVSVGLIHSQGSHEKSNGTVLQYNQNISRNFLQSLIERNRMRSLSAETKETENLSFEELQRLLTLEQLKLIRLQQLQSQKEIGNLSGSIAEPSDEKSQ